MTTINNFPTQGNSLENKLEELAKKTVLEDIKANFKSSFLLPEAVTSLIDSILGKGEFEYVNKDSILISLLTEVENSDFKNAHYDNITRDIIDRIIEDLS